MEKYITIQNSIVALDCLGDGSFPEEWLLDVNLKTHHYNGLCMYGRQLDSQDRAKTVGQVQKFSRVESPWCLAMGKTEKTRTLPPG